MDLKDKIRDVLIEKIKRIDINMLSFYEEDKEIIKNLYKLQVIEDKQIESALEIAVFNQARKDYELMIKKRDYIIWADHIGSPKCLAYALEKNIFLGDEINKIPFDHGEDADKFIGIYGEEDLLKNLRKEIFNPKKIKSKKDYCRCEGNCCDC